MNRCLKQIVINSRVTSASASIIGAVESGVGISKITTKSYSCRTNYAVNSIPYRRTKITNTYSHRRTNT